MVNFNYSYAANLTPGQQTAVIVISAILSVISIGATWRLFEKTDVAGWKCLIPIYNLYKEVEIVTGSGWTVDEEASTSERTVLYYASVLAPGEVTSPFADTLTINGKVVKLANEAGDLDYDQVTFHVQAVADAVQDHNGDAAMTSAWGRTNHAG